MLNITGQAKELCFKDSTRTSLKAVMFYWVENEYNKNGGYWQYFTTLSDSIILESMQFDEGIIESGDFQLGSLVCPTMKLSWENTGVRFKDCACVIYQELNVIYQELNTGYSENISYFEGYVNTEEIIENGRTVSAEIVPHIYKKLDKTIVDGIDVLETLIDYSNYGFDFANVLGLTLGRFGISINPEELKANFPNAKFPLYSFEELNANPNLRLGLPDGLTIRELLKQAAEFLGANMKLKTKKSYFQFGMVFDKNRQLITDKYGVIYESGEFDKNALNPNDNSQIEFFRFSDTTDSEEISKLENAYVLPYYISLISDKTKKLKYEIVKIEVDNGFEKNLIRKKPNIAVPKNTYTISNNIFLKNYYTVYENAEIDDINPIASISEYIFGIGFYDVDLDTVYPPFIEPADYLIAKYQGKANLPEEYTEVQNFKFHGQSYIDTGIRPNETTDDEFLAINNIQMEFDFSIDISNISAGSLYFFSSDVGGIYYRLNSSQNKYEFIGNFDIYSNTPTFIYPQFTSKDRLNFKIDIQGDSFNYGFGNLSDTTVLSRSLLSGNTTLKLGSTMGLTSFKIYHFYYAENNNVLLDLYPCKRNIDGKLGLYNTVNGEFLELQGNVQIYTSGDTVIPVLSSHTRGIHSMKANMQNRLNTFTD